MLITGQGKGQLLTRPLLDSPMVIGIGPGGHSRYANLCVFSVKNLANPIAAPTSSNRLPLTDHLMISLIRAYFDIFHLPPPPPPPPPPPSPFQVT